MLKEIAEIWKALALEVIRTNDLAEKNLHASRAFRAANGLAAVDRS
jgi:hypothetical protein